MYSTKNSLAKCD